MKEQKRKSNKDKIKELRDLFKLSGEVQVGVAAEILGMSKAEVPERPARRRIAH